MYVISPWSRGGWVNSQVFDHTSVLRFLEARFGVKETEHLAIPPRGVRRPHERLQLRHAEQRRAAGPLAGARKDARPEADQLHAAKAR
jgi:phospholipase C